MRPDGRQVLALGRRDARRRARSRAGRVLIAAALSGGHSFNGGGFIADARSVTVENARIVDNYASIDGGGILMILTSDLHLIDSTVSGNIGNFRGGGIKTTAFSERSTTVPATAPGRALPGPEPFGRLRRL